MKGKLRKGHGVKRLARNNSGFAFTVTAIVVALLIGTVTGLLRNYLSVNTATSSKNYSSAQAFWSAMSGIDYLLESLAFDAGNTSQSFTMHPSTIDITTELINLPIDSTYRVTSTGTHGGHTRRLRLLMKPPTPFDNSFFDIDSTGNWDYTHDSECETPGLPGGRYWGSSCMDCPGEDEGFQLPIWGILDTLNLPLKYPDADPYDPTRICYWLGRKEQNPKFMNFKTIESSGMKNIQLSFWLGAGIDVEEVADQDDFQIGDNFEVYANGVLIEHWSPLSNFQAMSPQIDVTVGDIQTQFQEYTVNISSILGSVDTLSIGFIGNTNTDEKYTGFGGVTLSYDLNWVIDAGSLQEF
jgi:hypothetical protein